MDSIQEKKSLHNQTVDHELTSNNKKRPLNTSIKLRKPRKHSWSIIQNENYISFLQKHQHLMTDIYTRKINKIFRKMSESVGTRSPSQVKSHHQKLQMRYKTISRILIRVKQYLERLKNKIEMSEEDCRSFSPTDKSNNEVLVNHTQLDNQSVRYLGKGLLFQDKKCLETQNNTMNWEAYIDFE